MTSSGPNPSAPVSSMDDRRWTIAATSTATNGWDQRAAGVDLDLTKKRTTAAPLHPLVLPSYHGFHHGFVSFDSQDLRTLSR
ncbi:hypothetical protein TBK1r_66390 [Stieleria magnilauensis]|uniref:Uncharacterized protein n=1 Tax=Stieleria magnilauensis TaxID=2527963 RepID=A0ABX5Y003_9BACT|nr:hypothetical protein TBK1r_66390 [Planctomycetes bacterium TBK1r]